MIRFGVLPRNKFTPPKANRGGGYNFAKKLDAPLTGSVQGRKAAKGEERLARTLDKGVRKGIVRNHIFRWTTLARGVVGWKELDFLIFKANGAAVPVSVKGRAFVHRNAGDVEQDRINEIIIIAKLREYGVNAERVITVYDTELETQEMADKTGRRLGVYR